jgi:1-acylglycerone phosphate reductase
MGTGQKTALVTGTSKGGVGDHIAQELHKRGFRVFATARTLSKVEHLRQMGLEVLILDVTSSESIAEAVQHVRGLTNGTLDILVNNSGVGALSCLLSI